MPRKKTSSAARVDVSHLTPKEQEQRRRTIAQLNPGFLEEMQHCANSLDMTLEEFTYHLDEALEDEDYYHNMGGNESYYDFDWNKIWVGYELLTGRKVPPSRWGRPRVPFSCAC